MARSHAVRWQQLLAAAALSAALPVHAQQVVPVEKGSYASQPPADAGAATVDMVARTFPLVGPQGDRAIPTNKFWTHLLDGKNKGSLWTYPLRVDPTDTGLNLFLPVKWSNGGNDVVAESPLRLEGTDFKTSAVQIKEWSDWLLSIRVKQSDTQFMDVTVGEGMPCVWIESTSVAVTLIIDNGATFAGPGGRAVSFPYSGGQFSIAENGRTFGIYLPRDATVTRDGDKLQVTSTGKSFVTLAALHAPQDLAYFAKAAYAIPRTTEVQWAYDPAKGKVSTTWHVKTEPLVPGAPDVVVQGFLPHHYRDAELAGGLKLDGPVYLTPRGPMKTTIGNNFQLIYGFQGFLPILPAPIAGAPASAGKTPDTFDVTRMSTYFQHAAKKTTYGDDTYWGGKDLIRFSQHMLMAKQLGDPSYEPLKKLAHDALADWLTYTPGEKSHYFTRYENWHALIGIGESYDSGRFNDQHFHLGYFTHSVALLAMEDPAFLKDYGDMIRMVAKQYANYDRTDTRFPFFRTFDLWAGHSWAGGLGSPGGENQESTSEAMQSWIGLYLLGTMMDDKNMTAAGAMGYAMESRASMEYWFNLHGDLLPKEYKHPIVGVLWSGGDVFGTYFSGDPAWIYGIQTLPQSPGMDYLVRDGAFAKKIYATMLAERKVKEGTDNLAKMGDLGNVILSQESQSDPPAAVAELDRLWAANVDVATTHANAGVAYYQAHAYNQLGARQWDVRLSLPTSAVYMNATTNVTTYAAYNPRPYPVVVTATKSETVAGSFLARSRELTTVTALQPAAGKADVAASYPADGDKSVARLIDTLYLVFPEPVDEKTLAAIHLDGPSGKSDALTFSTQDDGRVVAAKIASPLRPGDSYKLVVPTSVQLQKGAPALAAERVIAFTLEKQPALALDSSEPADGAAKVSINVGTVSLAFNAPLDPNSLSAIHIDGTGNAAKVIVKPTLAADRAHVTLAIAAPLQVDTAYTVIIPTALATAAGDHLAKESKITFSTPPAACPPNVYTDSFAGGGIGKDENTTVDLHNPDHPHGGKFAIKITAGEKDGAVYFFNGASDHDAARTPIDLSAYDEIEFYLRGDTAANSPGFIWAKIGHPVFDKAFNQARLEGVSPVYKRFTLKIPDPKTSINTLLSIGVPAGKTVYLDDIRFLKKH